MLRRRARPPRPARGERKRRQCVPSGGQEAQAWCRVTPDSGPGNSWKQYAFSVCSFGRLISRFVCEILALVIGWLNKKSHWKRYFPRFLAYGTFSSKSMRRVPPTSRNRLLGRYTFNQVGWTAAVSVILAACLKRHPISRLRCGRHLFPVAGDLVKTGSHYLTYYFDDYLDLTARLSVRRRTPRVAAIFRLLLPRLPPWVAFHSMPMLDEHDAHIFFMRHTPGRYVILPLVGWTPET